MTKTVRITNADTSDWKVKVIIQQKDKDGFWINTSASNLDYPGQQSSTLYIHNGQRIVIEEDGQTDFMYIDKAYIKRLEEKVKSYAS